MQPQSLVPPTTAKRVEQAFGWGACRFPVRPLLRTALRSRKSFYYEPELGHGRQLVIPAEHPRILRSQALTSASIVGTISLLLVIWNITEQSHLSVKEHKCTQCGHSFGTSQVLKRHQSKCSVVTSSRKRLNEVPRGVPSTHTSDQHLRALLRTPTPDS
ncbi:hypothetical protein R3P38DRAFT_3203603 [Favolaschia claudopus]|uniref:C2H2-type domain-containing protein n=1 Tax=Favolaschia claudopus TaxID=2862362 RepID=A0AAW0AV77_9AGAR